MIVCNVQSVVILALLVVRALQHAKLALNFSVNLASRDTSGAMDCAYNVNRTSI